MPKATQQGVPVLGPPALSSRCAVSTRWGLEVHAPQRDGFQVSLAQGALTQSPERPRLPRN